MSENEIRPPARRGNGEGQENAADPDRAGSPAAPSPPPSPPPPAHPAAPTPAAAHTSEAQLALEEARRALRLAAEKAGIALREVGKEMGAEMGAAAAEVREAVRPSYDRRAAHEARATHETRETDSATGSSPVSAVPSAGATADPSPESAESDADDAETARPRPEPPGSMAEPWESGPTAIGLDANVAAALAYVGWAMTGILFYYVFEPRDRFVRFHALQSILLTAALMVVGVSMAVVPLIGSFLFGMAAIGFILVWLLAIWKALRYEEYPLPFIGDIARSQVARGSR